MRRKADYVAPIHSNHYSEYTNRNMMVWPTGVYVGMYKTPQKMPEDTGRRLVRVKDLKANRTGKTAIESERG